MAGESEITIDGAPGLVSADSHVIETPDVWKGVLEPTFWPNEGRMFQEAPGGMDPEARLKEMLVDGVVAEVLYPSLALKLFAIEDPGLQEHCCRLYNQWLIDFCAADPRRLIGVGVIPTYDIDRALEEVRFCSDGHLRGIMVWQTPHPDLPFTTDHYDPLWALAQSLRLPLSMHILTGFNYSRQLLELGIEQPMVDAYRGAVNQKLLCVMDALLDFILGGALERFPELDLVLVENEIGWLPFVLDQWDYYFKRFQRYRPVPLEREPSAYFARQVFVTFFRDPLAGRLLGWWGSDNCMWSNDYPHGNTTWPNSRQFIAEHLGALPQDIQDKLTRTNAERLYGAITR